MSPDTRACIAYAALRLISAEKASAVYDHDRSLYVSINGAVNHSRMHLYDFSRNCHFGGTGNNGQFNLYDFDQSTQVQLEVAGNHYQGFDHATACRFSGVVEGTSTAMYDASNDCTYNYTL